MNDFLKFGNQSKGYNATLGKPIIQKIENPQETKEIGQSPWWVVSKILTKRLKKIIPKVIGES